MHKKVVILTGAGGALCSILAIVFAKWRFKVTVLDLKKEAIQRVSDDLNTFGGTAIRLVANVLNNASHVVAKKNQNWVLATT